MEPSPTTSSPAGPMNPSSPRPSPSASSQSSQKPPAHPSSSPPTPSPAALSAPPPLRKPHRAEAHPQPKASRTTALLQREIPTPSSANKPLETSQNCTN